MDLGGSRGSGRFEIRGTLGSGGAGVVYRVHDHQLGREVALKLLRQASGRDLYRFKREFRALADIVHPNLVALHELHASDGDWYFTMELVEGVSFIDWVRPGRASGPGRGRADIIDGRADHERLVAALVQLADALHALHQAGKLHRDLKPSNVLVAADGRLVVLDFGLVASLAEGEPERLAVGTPVYMSPEQASDQPLGEASDWYAVGAMTYEALTGRRPFEGESEDVMTRKQTEQPVHPAQLATLGPGGPAELAQLCMALLQPRPAARPRGPQILAQLGGAPSLTTREITRSYPPPTFVGRRGELEQLRRALADARRGAVAVVVRGASGIGKSALVRRFVRSLGDAVIAVEGRCFEREAVPFKMLDGVVDALTGALLALAPDPAVLDAILPRDLGPLVRMFPVLRRVPRIAALAPRPPQVTGAPAAIDPQVLRPRAFRALHGVLARLARLRPLVVFVDDAHWGDGDSAAFLGELIHGGDPGVLVIVAHRPEDYLGIVAQLRRPPGGTSRRGDLRELDLGALAVDDAARLVALIGTGTDDGGARAREVVAAGAGNPLLLTELARAPADAEALTISALVRARVARLSPEAQAMLAVSAIAGRPLAVAIAAHAAGVVGGYEEATQLSLERLATLRQVGDEALLHPAHDYVRTAVLAGLDAESRAGWHEAVARAFEAVQGDDRLDSQAVVEHWLAAGHTANAAHHALGAAHHAEQALAFRRAAELYEIALAYGPWDTAGRRDLLRRKAHAFVCAGQLDEAAHLYAHAAQLLADAESVDLERLAVEALIRGGRLGEALPAAERLLAHIGLRIPLGSRRGRGATSMFEAFAAKLRGHDYTERDAAQVPPGALLAIDVLYSISSGLAFADPALGRVVQAQLMRTALDAGEPVRVCLALAQELCYAAAGGSRNRAPVEALAARLRGIAMRLGHPEVIGLADTAIGIAAHMGGRWRDARGSLEAGLGTLRDRAAGTRWEIDVGDAFWLATLYYLGEWQEMARLTQLLLRDAIDRGDAVAQLALRSGRCAMAWLLANKPGEARAQLAIVDQMLGESAESEAGESDFDLRHVHALIASANLDLYTGASAVALSRIAQAWPRVERLGALRVQQIRIELTTLRARASLAALAGVVGPLDDRVRPIRALADELVREGAGWATGLGQLVRAAAHAWTGSTAAAIGELAAAEDTLATAGMLGHLQVARVRRGRLEGGAVGVARSEAARDLLRDLGAVEPDAVADHVMPWPR